MSNTDNVELHDEDIEEAHDMKNAEADSVASVAKTSASVKKSPKRKGDKDGQMSSELKSKAAMVNAGYKAMSSMKKEDLAQLLDALEVEEITEEEVAESAYDFRGAVWSAEHDKYTPDSLMREYRKKYNSQKFITFDNTIGYDRYFIVKGDSKSLNTDIDELDIDADASQSQINKSFMKFANSKKANRILASQFAQIIA